MKNNTIKWLYKTPGKNKIYILFLMILQSLNGASGVFYALLLRHIIDSAIDNDKNLFIKYIVLAILLMIGQIFIRTLIRWVYEYARSQFENLYKLRLMNHILHKDFSHVNAVHSGEWMNRLTNDTVVVADSYVDILPGLIGMAVKMMSAIVMMLILDWRFSSALLPCGVVMFFFTYGFRKRLKKMHKAIQEKDGRLRIFFQEHIGSLMLIRSYATEQNVLQNAKEKMKEHQTARMNRNHFSNICNIGFSFAFNGMYLLCVCWCSYGIFLGTISFGTLTAMTQLISQIQSPFANITAYIPKFYAMTASAERLSEIEQFQNDSQKEPYSAEDIIMYYNEKFHSIGLDQAEFTYYPTVKDLKNLSKENQPITLQNITLEIQKGEYVAFVGESGCGKSTVLKLLMSVYTLDQGNRFINDSEGNHELSAEWRRLFAYVPQGNQLMSGTIREILSFSEESKLYQDDKMQDALKIACADGFVNQMEQGIDTLLGERGTGISEGQMQRIAIARAIFSDCPILLLDEATSALDEDTERCLLQNLRSMTNKTVIIVTHRLEALKICDRVLKFSKNGIESASLSANESYLSKIK